MPDQPTTDNPLPGPSPDEPGAWRTPWVQLKSYSFNPCLYPSMVKIASPDAEAGDLVSVYDKEGRPFGTGLYNPKARVPLRMVYHGTEPVGEDYLLQLLDRAVDLRLNVLRLPAVTEAFRVVHSQGDGLSGLVVDRYGDVLSVDVHSLGVFNRLGQWLPPLHSRLGTKRAVIEVDPKIAHMEGIPVKSFPSDPVRSVRIREHGVRYEVNFEEGHKTGFFCDQRENRRRFATWTQDKRVLDLCCYTGGFALAAKVSGGAAEVTGVDLDEKAVAQALANAKLNQARVEWVHGDAFVYGRQMQKNGRVWDAVVLDPPKLLLSREEERDGLRKYEDLNQIAVALVERGGLFVTCSCSGLLGAEEFELIVCRAAHRAGRRLQILDRTGAAEDHPVMSNAPEGRYLKCLWSRVL
jgi:23S rRNA (cytosine1962-C5)-methyltransferase